MEDVFLFSKTQLHAMLKEQHDNASGDIIKFLRIGDYGSNILSRLRSIKQKEPVLPFHANLSEATQIIIQGEVWVKQPKPKRLPGVYRVICGDIARAAEWCGKDWYLPGIEEPYSDKDFREIGDRIYIKKQLKTK